MALYGLDFWPVERSQPFSRNQLVVKTVWPVAEALHYDTDTGSLAAFTTSDHHSDVRYEILGKFCNQCDDTI